MKLKIMTIVATVLATPIAGQAQELCGGFLEKGRTTAVLRDIGPQITCSIKTPKKCSIAFSAELRPGDFLGDVLHFSRKSKDSKWVVYLQVGKDIDVANGVSITVDDNDPMDIPSEFLSHGPRKFPNRGYIDEQLTQIVVDQVRAGKKTSASAKFVDGKTFTSLFSERKLEGAAKAFKWAECMQKVG